MTRRSLWIAVACAFAGAVLLAVALRAFLGSGNTCEGIGFGCTLERDTDTLLVVTVYCVGALLTLLAARRLARRGHVARKALIVGFALTALVSGGSAWSQLPHHPAAPGPLRPAIDRWDEVFAEGRSAAPAGTQLGDALRRLRRRGPLPCHDRLDRDTGAREVRWSARGMSDPATARMVGDWADRLGRGGLVTAIDDPSGDPASDRRLEVSGSGPAAGGQLYVRASTYISELEIRASTGCHRG